MIRGTTPTIAYHISVGLEFSDIVEAWITVEQETKHKHIEKTWKYSEETVVLDAEERIIYTVMSQNDSLSFDTGSVETQLRILLNNGTSLATKSKTVSMNKILKEGVING